MAKMYHQKGDISGSSFNSFNQPIVILIEDLLATDDAARLITMRAIDAAASMLTAWEQTRNLIEPVEGK